MKWNQKAYAAATIGAFTVTALLGAGISAAQANAAVEVGNPSVNQQTKTPTVTRVALPLAHDLSLTDAIAVAQTLGEKVVSFGFTNQNVTGEFSPDAGQTVNAFLENFQLNYGTQPEVNNLVVVRSTDPTAQRSAASKIATIQPNRPVFLAPPVVYGGTLKAKMDRDAALRPAAQAKSAAAASSPMETNTTSTVSTTIDWRPDYTDESILGTSGQNPFFWESYYWYDGGLNNLPDDIGLEFEINQDNPNVGTPQNVRPLCFDTQYKHRFWANNENYSWSATDATGGTGNLGAYADYNDAEDLCRNQSIAIGLKYPKALSNAQGYAGLYVQITTPLGFLSSNAFSGNVQAVASDYCGFYPGNTMSSTDCMGITKIENVWNGAPSYTYNRSTASLSRGWTIPSKCWTTDGKGYGTTIAYSCTGE